MPELPAGEVTFCFTDIESSTALNALVGDSVYAAVLARHRELLRSAWTGLGGIEVGTEGDGCFVVFTDVDAAVSACIRAQVLLDREGWPADAEVRVRMGLHTGQAEPNVEHNYASLVVSQAARVAACAHGGQVIVSPSSAALIASRAKRRLGRFRVRDFGEPIELFQLVDAALRDEFPRPRGVRSLDPTSAVEGPSWLRSSGAWPFVGRRNELERLRRCIDDARRGHARYVVVGGEPGVGKSRLVAELVGHARAYGMLVLGGRCDRGKANPYGIVTDALRQVVATVDGAALPEHLGKWPHELVRIVPELAEVLPPTGRPLASDADTERWRLLDAIVSAFRALAAAGGLVLVIDDAQWVPDATSGILRHMIRADWPEGLAVLGTFRNTELEDAPQWQELLAELGRLDGTERIDLLGLDVNETAELIGAVAAHGTTSVDAELVTTMQRLTAGNPFFAGHLLSHLDSRGDVVVRDGRLELSPDVDEMDLPTVVGEVVRQNVHALGDEVDAVLTAASVASVAGLEFSVGPVDALVTDGGVVEVLERAARAHLVVEIGPDRWRFVHALVPTTLYRQTSLSRRSRLHGEVANTLERDGHAEAAEIARHWSLSTREDASRRAANWYVTAGRDAMNRLAPGEAVARYRAALEHDSVAVGGAFGDDDRVEVRIELGVALRRIADPTSSAVLMSAARDAELSGRADLMGRAIVADSRGFWNSIGHYDDERVRIIEDALRLLSEEDSALRARLLATLSAELLFHPRGDERFAAADAGLEMALRVGDEATIFDVALHRLLSTSSAHRVDAHWRSTANLIARADRIGDPHRQILAALAHYFIGIQAGQVVDVAPSIIWAHDEANTLGQPMLMWLAGALHAGLLIFRGDLDEAEAIATVALGLGQAAGQDDAFLWYSGQLAALRLQQGRISEIIDLAADFVATNPQLAAWRAMLAVAMCDLDRLDEARVAFRTMSQDGFATLADDQMRVITLCLCSEACRHVGTPVDADRLYRILAPLAHLSGSMAIFSIGSVERSLGVLATLLDRHATAEAHLRRAIESNERNESPLWTATARLDLASLHLARGGRDHAALGLEAVDRALLEADGLGSQRIERLAAGLRVQLASALAS